MRPLCLPALATLGVVTTLQADSVTIRSAQIWPDTAGQHINAHCGSIVHEGDTW